MDLSRIKIFSKKNGISVKWVAEQIGMSPENLRLNIKKNKIQAEDLKKIADVLKVDINEFFDTKINSSNQTHHSSKQSQKGTGNTINTGVISEADGKYNKVEIKLKREIESLKKDVKQLKTEVKGLEKEVLLKDEIIQLLKGGKG